MMNMNIFIQQSLKCVDEFTTFSHPIPPRFNTNRSHRLETI